MLIFISLLFTIREFFLILIPCICKAVDRISNHWSIKTYHLTNLHLTFMSLFKEICILEVTNIKEVFCHHNYFTPNSL